jgi:hypothetical protein
MKDQDYALQQCWGTLDNKLSTRVENEHHKLSSINMKPVLLACITDL